MVASIGQGVIVFCCIKCTALNSKLVLFVLRGSMRVFCQNATKIVHKSKQKNRNKLYVSELRFVVVEPGRLPLTGDFLRSHPVNVLVLRRI